MISSEAELGYFRPMVSYYLYDAHKPNLFYLHPESWYAENNIDLKLGTTIRTLDPQNKTLITTEGELFVFDRLILANGSRNNVPPIQNIDKKGVFTVRTKKDADDIKAMAKEVQEAVVIGGGLLGLEFAWGLKTLGLDVTVLEIADRLLPRQLDYEGSRLFEEGVLKTGIKIRKGVKIQELIGKESVEGIRIGEGEGEVINAQMVLVSAGVKPNKELAESAGIACNRGILTDTSMKTSVEDIYAAGDVAEVDGFLFGLWPMSLEQGKVAGASAVGAEARWEVTVPSSIFKSMGMHVFSIGDIMGFEAKGLRSITDYDKTSGIYKKLYFEDDVYVGGIQMGSLNKAGVMQKSIGKGMSAAQMVDAVILK
jgi:NAD(P)H-nitrite reductase large subunit